MHRRSILLAVCALAQLVGCSSEPAAPPADVKLVVAAYSAPREAFERVILPAFRAKFERDTGKTIQVDASYLASGAQTRAVLGGFEADVVVLALEPDIDKLVAAKLVAPEWRTRNGHDGVVASTLVAFSVRPGNPKHITSFADLARPGVEVLMPDPKTSGGARWNVNALLGAALRGKAGVAPNDMTAAASYLESVLANVLILDKGARESMITFEKGVGDVAVTYESEITAGVLAHRKDEKVLPDSTLRIDTVGSVVDAVVDRHGTRAAAEALIDFLALETAQRGLAEYGFRPIGDAPPPNVDVWTVDFLGGWKKVSHDVYDPGGIFPKAWEAVTAR